MPDMLVKLYDLPDEAPALPAAAHLGWRSAVPCRLTVSVCCAGG